MSNSNLGNLNGGFNISDSVNTSDPNDYYSFNLSAQSSLKLTLNGLNANADLQLLNNSGTVLRSSSASGINQDVINIDNLAAGAYKARAYRVGGDTAYNLGVSTTNSASASVGTGLKGEYYDNKDLTNLKLTRTDGTVNFDWGSGSPVSSLIGADTFSARWTGQVQPKYSETYTFSTTSDDGVRLSVNGQQLINNWTDHAATENSGSITLAAGQKYDIKLEYYENTRSAVEKLSWSSPSQAKQIIPQTQLYAATSPTLGPPLNSQTGEQAKSADAFVDSIGVATHLNYTRTPYGRFNDIIKPRLQELGVRHIRDGLNVSNDGVIDAVNRDKLNELARLGIKSTLIMDPRFQKDPATAVRIAKSVPKSIEMVEGANELDHSANRNVNYKGQTYPGNLRLWQTELYKAFKADPTVSHLPVTTGASAGPASYSKINYASNSYDKVAFHYYVRGNEAAWGLDEYVLPNVREGTAPNKGLIVTETGWSNGAVSQKAEAKYVPRMYLEHFNRGIERSFLYQFAKESQSTSYESDWGILNYDGSPQPAFASLKNLIDLVEEPGAKFTPGKLDYKLSGDTTGVNHTLLQRSNGEFNLLLWQKDKSFDPSTNKDISVPNQSVTLTLNQSIGSAKTYLPLNSTSVVSSYTNPKSINLTVPDHPLLIKLA